MSIRKKNITLFALLLCFISTGLTRADEQYRYTIIGSLPDSIDNVPVYLIPISLSGNLTFKDSTTVLMEDSAIVHRGRFSFTGIADKEKQIYTIWSVEYPLLINGWVVVEPGSISYSYRDDEFRGYTYSKGTYSNNYLTDSIIMPSMQLAKFADMLMKGSIDIRNPEMSEQVSKMREQALAFLQCVRSFVIENIDNAVGEYLFLLFSSGFQANERNDILAKLSESARDRYN